MKTAQLAPFADKGVAARISTMIDQGFSEPGASDVSVAHANRGGSLKGKVVRICCPPSFSAKTQSIRSRIKELKFVCQRHKSNSGSKSRIDGPSLVVTAITTDPELIQRLVASPNVDRLNLGAVPTNQISWDQPHEGNLFEHLYARRAVQRRSRRFRPRRLDAVFSSSATKAATGRRAGESADRSAQACKVMRILYLTGGAGQMYCGSCLRDNALRHRAHRARSRRNAVARLHANAHG